jgi:hypothetical protein
MGGDMQDSTVETGGTDTRDDAFAARKRGRPSKGPGEDDGVIYVRVAKSVLERLDLFVASERKRTGYSGLTRSEIVRSWVDAKLAGEGSPPTPNAN